MMKRCIVCGTQLHEDASFCHACAHSQIEKESPNLPRPWKKRVLTSVLLLILLLGIVSVPLVRGASTEEVPHEEKPTQEMKESSSVEQTSQETLRYRTEDGEYYELKLSFSMDGEAQAHRSKAVAADQGKDGSFPSLLYIVKESSGEFVTEEFLTEWTEQVSIDALPQNGAQKLDLKEPYYDALEFPNAALKSDLHIGSYNVGDNIVRWTLQMKNGDILTLDQTITIELMSVQKYSWTEISMNNLSELNALLERLDESTAHDQVVEIYLPPITYEGGLELRGRSYRLYGSSDESGAMTTFTQPSVSKTESLAKMEFHNICFLGDGGTGLSCEETLFLEQCIFEGWDIAVHIQDQAWSQSDGCTYRGNRIGLLFDCSDDGSFGPNYDKNLFEDNEIGVQIKAVHTERTLCFDDSIFRGNDIDIDNQKGQDLDLSRTIFQKKE